MFCAGQQHTMRSVLRVAIILFGAQRRRSCARWGIRQPLACDSGVRGVWVHLPLGVAVRMGSSSQCARQLGAAVMRFE
mgnify:CR=1 FL=1